MKQLRNFNSKSPSVYNMKSPNGNTVPNQFIITTYESGLPTFTFQSYATIIAQKRPGGVYLDTSSMDYSRTTSKYLYRFLSVTGKKEVQTRINTGVYRVTDLNGGE